MPKNKKRQFNFKPTYLLLFAILLFVISLVLTESGLVPKLNLPQPTINNGEAEPSKQKIEISGIEVNDFANESANGEQPSFYTIEKTPEYHLFYIPEEELFYLSITSYPFDDIRPLAEQQLLNSLAISEMQACALNVDITTTTHSNPAQAGKVYGLSFCNDK